MTKLELDIRLRWVYVAIATYILIFLVTRLVNLTAFPLFVDEGRHIVGAQLTTSGDLFNGLKFGLKQLYIWIIAIPFSFFGNHLLVARMVSVLSGLISAGLCYKLAVTLYPGRQTGYIAALFYLISPFALFFDRLALTDSLLTMLVGVNILVSLQLWREPSLKRALALGIVFGLIALTKAYAIFYAITPLLFWLILGKINVSQASPALIKIEGNGGAFSKSAALRHIYQEASRWGRIAKLMAVAYIIPLFTLFLILIVGQNAYRNEYAAKFSPEVLLASPRMEFLGVYRDNLWLAVDWLGTYLTLPFASLLIFTLVLIVIKRDKVGILLSILLILPFLFLPFIFTVWYSRYLMPSIIPISILIAWGIDHLVEFVFFLAAKIRLKSSRSSLSGLMLQGGLLLVLSIPSFPFDFWLITEPLQAPLPASDRWDYIESRFSGYGLEESAQIVAKFAERYPELIILRGTNLIDTISSLDVIGMSLYLPNPEKISFKLLGDLDSTTVHRLDTLARQAPTLTLRTFDVNDDSESTLPKIFEHPQAWKLASFPKPGQQVILDLYQWLLPPDFALHWFEQGGDADPKVAWQATDTLITSAAGEMVDWSQISSSTSEAMQPSLAAADVEYVFATPKLVAEQPELFAPFMTTDGTRLRLVQLPPGWRLAFVYPDINCNWCLFQLKPPGHLINIMLGETVELEGYDISAIQLPPGASLHVTLYWNSLGILPESYIVFVHLLDANGNLVGQVDELPLQGHWTTNSWRMGDKLADRHTLSLDATLSEGDYTLVVGLYNPINLERLPIQAEQNLIMNNGVKLTTISIK
jgi:hypothetical protein